MSSPETETPEAQAMREHREGFEARATGAECPHPPGSSAATRWSMGHFEAEQTVKGPTADWLLHAPWLPVDQAKQDGTAYLFHGIHTDSPADAARGVEAGYHWFAILQWDVWREPHRWVFAKDGAPAWSEPDAMQILEVPQRSHPPAPADRTIDTVAAFCRLPIDVQRQIGGPAVAVGIGMLAEDSLDGDLTAFGDAARFFRIGTMEASLRLQTAVQDALFGDDTTGLKPPSLPALGIRQCRRCGCTDSFACDGCRHPLSWDGPDLCSYCAGFEFAAGPSK